MKLLHTSDWHLGHLLHGQKRTDEFESLIDWMLQTIEREQIEILIVAGDLFDTTTPSHQAQSLYFSFLGRLVRTACRHAIIVAGNHDSPSLMDAPKALLEQLDIHIVGAVSHRQPKVGSLEESISYEDEVFVLNNEIGQPQIIVCAVPYLKERDIRRSNDGENPDERNAQILDGIRAHYARVCDIAESKRQALSADIPIVATGHLFTSGSVADNGERELLVGSLLQLHAGETFPATIDYLALGHLHAPQKVGGNSAWRYSGSPLPMSFSDARQPKSVCIVEFEGREPVVRKLEIPCFQELYRIIGIWSEIEQTISQLRDKESTAWLEIVHQGEVPRTDLRERIEERLQDTSMIALAFRESGVASSDGVLSVLHASEKLQDLDEGEVFERLLAQRCSSWSEDALEELRRTFREALQGLCEQDFRAG